MGVAGRNTGTGRQQHMNGRQAVPALLLVSPCREGRAHKTGYAHNTKATGWVGRAVEGWGWEAGSMWGGNHCKGTHSITLQSQKVNHPTGVG